MNVERKVIDMKTNFQMLKELLEAYHPQERGIATAYEVKLIKEKLHIEEMDVLQLHNLRDFIVLFLSNKDTMEAWDQMSAISSVIDRDIRSKSGLV